MTSRSPAPGELWLAYLHFSDKPDIGKVRPALIVEPGGAAAVAVAAKVTSADLPSRGIPAVAIPRWEECGLRKPSWVRLDQRFELPYADILRDEPLGALPDDLFGEIATRIAQS